MHVSTVYRQAGFCIVSLLTVAAGSGCCCSWGGGAREGGHEDGAQAWRLLTSAALRLYARRDMSLTRRLHSWLSAVWTTAADAQVQVEVGRESVTWAINKLLAEAFTDALSATAPFRVARAVLDKTIASPGGGEAAGGGGII